MKLLNERGYIFIAFALLLPLFVLFMSLALELGRGFTRQTELQNIADAAALAGVEQIEHKGEAKLISDSPEDATEENAPNAVYSAAKKNMQGNGLEGFEPPKTLKKKESGEGTEYFYCVKIQDYVPLVLARMFLPDTFMPEGLPVSVVAWAKVKVKENDESLFDQLYNIGWEQTVELMSQIRGAKVGDDRVEKIRSDNGNVGGIYYNSSTDEQGKTIISRSEVVDTREVKTWKYMFIDFQPDIQIDKKKGILGEDGEYYFPFGNWDVTTELSADDWKKIKYTSTFSGGSGAASRDTVINNLMSTYGITEDEAAEVLNTPIENVVLFNTLHKIRVYHANRPTTAEELKEWERNRINQGGLPVKEQAIADYTGNQSLAQLVVRNSKGEIVASDPLLVRIESEDINKTHSFTNATLFYASSVRKLTIKIEKDNMADLYRPLVIYYYGPQDIDGNIGGGRESLPVTLELNANFKGILFAPNSKVIINGNGHNLRGMVVGDSVEKNALGYVTFDDFELLNMSKESMIDSNAIIRGEQLKRLK